MGKEPYGSGIGMRATAEAALRLIFPQRANRIGSTARRSARSGLRRRSDSRPKRKLLARIRLQSRLIAVH